MLDCSGFALMIIRRLQIKQADMASASVEMTLASDQCGSDTCKNKAQYKCLDCQSSMCATCRKAHDLAAFFRSHIVEEITEEM